MSQGSTVMPTTGTVAGLTFAQDVNAALKALLNCNSGASAPTNTASGFPELGQFWLDTSVTPNALRQYDGANWIVIGYIDATNHLWSPPVGGGAATIASATTTDIWASAASAITISGVAAITQLASADAVPGTMKFVTASGAFTLTHDATKLILPGAANITAAAGDHFLVLALSATNVAVLAYSKADGTSLLETGFFTQGIFFTGVISPAALSGNTNDWNPSGLATANTIRLSASSAINLTGILAPATDGKILILHNIGATNPIVLKASATSTAANQFNFSHDFTLRPNTSKAIIYDLTSARWRLLDTTGGKPPTMQRFVSPGSGTYNLQFAGTRRLRVRTRGAGGGGAGNGNSSGGQGGTGGNTSFNSIAAQGGSGGLTNNTVASGGGGTGGSGGSGSATMRVAGASGGGGVTAANNGLCIGGAGGGADFGSGGCISVGAGFGSSVNGAGGGGAGTIGASGVSAGGGGGAGEYVEIWISDPAATYAYTVGAGGTAGTAGTSGAAGGTGNDGYIIVEEHYD
jgi:hypothetical protein